MSTFQNKVYECSRQNASVFLNDKGTEWINEFKEGIKLEKGDTLRILGSFVNEQAQGDEIEITDDMSINVIHTPFIRGHSLATSDQVNNLLDLGMFGDIAYNTDATGIEPPHFLNDIIADPDGGFSQPLAADSMYENVIGTGANTINFGAAAPASLTTRSTWNADTAENYTDNAETCGITVDTSKNYKLFSNNSVDNELYLGQIVKKFILPVASGLANRNGISDRVPGAMDLNYTADTIRTPFEPLISDTTNYTKDQLGRFAGAPRPGMLFSTVNLAGSYGWFDSSGNGIYEIGYGANGATTYQGNIPSLGIPNLIGGVESMIGKVLAVKPFQIVVEAFPTDVFEILVTDWINPASIKNDVYRTSFTDRNYKRANVNTVQTATVSCIKYPHGAGQNEIGYNKNPAFNPINGLFNQYTPRKQIRGETTGTNAGYFIQSNSFSNKWAEPKIKEGSDNPSAIGHTEFDYGFGQPWGLSFPYNGGQCCGLTSQGDGGATANTVNQRANSYSIWHRQPSTGNSLDIALQIYDNSVDFTIPAPGRKVGQFEPPTSEPQLIGGYICVNEEVMMDIVKNGQNLLTETNNGSAVAGHRPRVWFEWGFQNMPSQYKTRHYAGNSLTRQTVAPHNYEHDNRSYEFRAGYDMCGKPDNKNYKNNNHNFGSTNGLVAGSGITTYLPQTVNSTLGTDGSPIVISTVDGLLNFTVTNDEQGAPYEYCGYNNAMNSIHFQQKDTGAVDLSKDNVNHRCTMVTTNPGAINLFTITCPPGVIPIIGNNLTSPSRTITRTYIPSNRLVIVFVTPLGGDNYQIQTGSTIEACTAGDILFLNNNTSGATGESGWGTNAQPWAADLIMIKEYLTQIKVDPGYYTKEQLGAEINEVLHFKTNKYIKDIGSKIVGTNTYEAPTTVGKLNQARGSEPSFITGNFIHTYIPEVSYGFTPVTTDNATDLNLTASTKDLTNELLTYDYQGIFYSDDPLGTPLPSHNGTTVRYVYEADTQGRNYFGKHLKLYSPPHLVKDNFNETGDQIHIIRLKGGALPGDAFDTGIWNVTKEPRFAGMYESLRSQFASGSTTHQGTYSTFAYRCRGVNNVCSHGGGAKIFCGANNLSIEFNELANRFNLFNLYTPIRPHQSQNPAKTDFDVDDAVPSAIICSKFTGDNDGLLSGSYISDLNGGAFTESEWGRSWVDNWKYDTDSNSVITQYGTNFLDALGYNTKQLSEYLGYGIYQPVSTPYTFAGLLREYGKLIRGDVKLTPAINGTNPFANDCLLINPVQQYFLEVESEDFFADDPPTLGTSPYYFIGSDLPVNHFMGNETGTKLPVVGINARNFHSFGFSFDVGATSVEYTIDTPSTVTSISTAIYDSNLKVPTNISKFSSVIYLLTKNNYVKSIDPQLLAQTLVNNQRFYQSQQLQYFQPPIAGLRTAPPVNIPQNYYQGQWNGSTLNPLDEDDTDDDI